MGEDTIKPAEEITSISAADTEMNFSGPAVLANKFYINTGPAGVRITFAEHYANDKTPSFRNAVLLSYQDGIAMYKLLQTVLKDIEASLEEAIAEQAAKSNG